MTPRYVDKEHKRLVIIEAAALVFAQHGWGATRMADVARAAGVGKGTLYEYFDSKDALFLAITEHVIGAISQHVIAAAACGGTPAERLRAIATATMADADKAREFTPLLLDFWAATSSSPLHADHIAVFQSQYALVRVTVERLLHEGIGTGDFRRDIDVAAVAASWLASIDGLFVHEWFDPSIEPAPLIGAFLDVVLAGIRAPKETEA